MDEYLKQMGLAADEPRTGIEEERDYFARLQREQRRPLWKRLFHR